MLSLPAAGLSYSHLPSSRAELNVTDLRSRSPAAIMAFPAVFCENLRFSVKNLRFSALSCALEMLGFPEE